MHKVELCVDRFGIEEEDDTQKHMTDELTSSDEEHGGQNLDDYQTFLHIGWMRPALTLKTLLLGYDILFLDVDQIVFKHPFSGIWPETTIAATLEGDDYTPEKNKWGLDLFWCILAASCNNERQHRWFKIVRYNNLKWFYCFPCHEIVMCLSMVVSVLVTISVELMLSIKFKHSPFRTQ